MEVGHFPRMGPLGIRIGTIKSGNCKRERLGNDIKRLVGFSHSGTNGQRCALDEAGCIPKNGLNPRPSEGEGAYSTEGACRSHLPLRGKLGWMTPRTGQKKTGKVGMHL